MKGFGVVLFVVLASLALAGCGGDNTTTFVLDSGSPTASASAKASASAAATASVAASSSTLPSTASATPIAGNQKIIIDSPDASTTISSPVQVSGTASVDKGTVVGVVLDAAGNELGRATATASATKPDYGHYDLTISFTGAASGTKGQIKVFGVSPRDGTTPTSYYFITIKFS